MVGVFVRLAAATALCCFAATAQVLEIERVAGLVDRVPGALLQDFVAASETALCEPSGVALGEDGTLYVADSCRWAVRAVSPEGVIRTIAGVGPQTESNVAAGPARLASLGIVYGLAREADGSLLVGGQTGIFRIAPDGSLSRVSDEGVWDVAPAPDGSVYAAAWSAILRFDSDGSRRVLAGRTEPLRGVFGLTSDDEGNVYFAESGTHLVHRMEPNGSLHLVGGVRNEAGAGSDGDGGPARAARFNRPFNVALGPDGALYVATFDRIRKIDPAGTVTTVAGGGSGPRANYFGEGGPATEASLINPWSLTVSDAGDLFIAERDNGRIRRVDGETGVITTYAGSASFTGASTHAETTSVARPSGLAFDLSGVGYFADTLNHRVRRIGPDGSIETVAGNGESGFSGDGGQAREARLSFPAGVALAPNGDLYIADTVNNRIRRVDATGVISTIAGDGTYAFRGDGDPATAAWLAAPKDVEIDAEGAVVIADTDNHRVRRITGDGLIRTIAGSGLVGTEGDGGPAREAQLIIPEDVAVARDGSVYIADPGGQNVRRVTPGGVMQTVAGRPTSLLIDGLTSVAADPDGTIFVAANRTVHRLTLTGAFPALDVRDADSGFRPAGSLEARLGVDPFSRLWLAGNFGVFRERSDGFRLPLVDVNGLQVGSRRGFLPLSPGAVIQVFGRRFGLGEGTAATLSPAGRLPRSIGDLELWLDGAPLPLLFGSDGQVNAVVPLDLDVGSLHELRVVSAGLGSNVVRLEAAEATPAIFTNDGHAAALNQDGTVNRLGAGAEGGSIVSLFLTGMGRMATRLEDGQVAAGELVLTELPVTATVGGVEAEVLYAGVAPGLIHGVVQVNVRIPEGLTTLNGRTEVVVWADGVPSQIAVLAVD